MRWLSESPPSDARPTTVMFVSASGWLGGPGRSLLTLMSNLPDGREKVLISPTRGDLLYAIHARGIEVIHVPLVRGHGFLRHRFGRVAATLQIAVRIIRERHRITAIHANGYSELHLVAVGAILTGVRVVAWFHAYRAERWDRRLGPVWRRLLRKYDFVAVSNLARRVVVETGLAPVDAIAVVPNPIEPPSYGSRPGGGSGSQEHSKVVVGYLGSTIEDKGFDLMPSIIEHANSKSISWLFFVTRRQHCTADEDSAWRALEVLSERGQVTMTGRTSDVSSAYRACDIIICPSRRESFGRIAAEAMINGVPVVASDIEPFRDLLGQGAGLLFPVGDVVAAARAVDALAFDSELRQRIGLLARGRMAPFEPARIAQRFSNLYRLEASSSGKAVRTCR